jgi:hypothetical protein
MKFPIRRAIGETFAFAMQNAADILRVLWAPFAVATLTLALVAPGFMEGNAQLAKIDPENTGEAMRLVGLLWPKALLILVMLALSYSMIFAGILRLVIRGERQAGPINLTFAADELRLLGTWMVQMLLAIAAALLSFTLSGALELLNRSGDAASVIGALIEMVCLVAAIWIALRVSLSSAAAIGAERLGVGPSWRATKGQLFGLFVFWLFWALVALVINNIVTAVTTPDYYPLMSVVLSPESTKDQIAQAEAQLDAMNAKAFDFTDPGVIFRFGITTLVGAISVAFAAITSGIAWRFLDEARPDGTRVSPAGTS